MIDTALDHLMSHIIADSQTCCWNWTGTIRPGGYTAWGRVPYTNYSAHRISWLIFNKAFPPAPLTLDHLCRNTRCVNPSHLDPVTIRENVMRGTGRTAMNARKIQCKRGHALSGYNLVINGRYRNCRTCRNLSDKRNRAHRREYLRAYRSRHRGQ